jgi:hypothetical protein
VWGKYGTAKKKIDFLKKYLGKDIPPAATNLYVFLYGPSKSTATHRK